MKQYDSTIQATARDLARLLARTRAAYPDTPWRPPWRPPKDARPLSALTSRGKANLQAIIEHRRRGLSYREIALATGLSKMSINTLVYRARTRGEWPDDLEGRKPPKASEA